MFNGWRIFSSETTCLCILSFKWHDKQTFKINNVQIFIWFDLNWTLIWHSKTWKMCFFVLCLDDEWRHDRFDILSAARLYWVRRNCIVISISLLFCLFGELQTYTVPKSCILNRWTRWTHRFIEISKWKYGPDSLISWNQLKPTKCSRNKSTLIEFF